MSKYVATLDHTDQVGWETSQRFREAKILTGSETIEELIQWGKKYADQPEIMIIVADAAD